MSLMRVMFARRRHALLVGLCHGGQCSATCGRGRQTRRVFCLVRRESQWIELDDVQCIDSGDVRPSDQQDCVAADDCSHIWLTGPFSQVPILSNILTTFAPEAA